MHVRYEQCSGTNAAHEGRVLPGEAVGEDPRGVGPDRRHQRPENALDLRDCRMVVTVVLIFSKMTFFHYYYYIIV